MSLHSVSTFARQLGARGRNRLLRVTRAAESGFILLESLIAIALITVIMGAVGAEYVSGLAATNHARLQSVAVEIAASNMDQVRSLHASDLVSGRGSNAVDAERSTVQKFTDVGSTALEAYDSAAASASTGKVSTLAATSMVGSMTYSVYRYLECTVAPSTSGSCVSAPSRTSLTANSLRAIVVVTWPQRGCASVTTATTSGPTCSYSTSSIINSDDDLTFDLNQPLPAAPVVGNPSTLTVAAGDVVNYAMTAQNNTGVAPFTWQLTSGAFPSGLTMAQDGTISGTVSTTASSTASSTITVTDAYLRTASATIAWTVEPALTITQVANQSNIIGSSANLSLSATGGGGTGYTFSVASGTLPPGLSVANGVISGTLTRDTTVTYPKTYQVSAVVSDPQTCLPCATTPRTASTIFTWTVNNPPIAESAPRDQAWTVSTALNSTTSVQMTASGGDGRYVWSATGLPTGVSINSASGLISGTPSATGSGTASVTVTDPTSNQVSSSTVTFAWTVYASPTITTPAPQTNSIGGTVNLPVASTCPNVNCTYSATNLPTGLSIDASSGVISGTVGGTAAATFSPRITVVDMAGATATTSTFSWTVLNAPTVTTLGTQRFTETALGSVAVQYTCPTSSCTLTLSGSVPGLGLTTSSTDATNRTASTSMTVMSSSGTIYVGGKVTGTAVTGTGVTSAPYTPVLSIATTSDNAMTSTSPGNWTAYTRPTVAALTDLTSASYAVVKLTAPTVSCPNTPCTYSITGLPAGLTVDPSTGIVSGTITSDASSTAFSVTVQVTDSAGVSAATPRTFNWTVGAATNNLAKYFNNVGVTADTNTNPGAFDGSTSSTVGNSFSAKDLARLGVNAGAPFVTNGLSFPWPATSGSGQYDNVLANGQTVAIQGTGTKLGILLSGAYGSPSGQATITYANGSTQNFTLSTPDWYNSGTTTNPAVIASAYRNKQNNVIDSHAVNIYYQGVTLTYPGVAVVSVKLPTIGGAVGPNVASMHIFAMSLTTSTLAGSFNNVGVTTSGPPAGGGNFDGSNNTYSKAALTSAGASPGGTVTSNGVNFIWPSTAGTSGSSDNVLANGQTFAASATGTTLAFLAASNGAATSGSGVITYTDGTQDTFTLNVPVWTGSAATAALSTTAYNSGTGNASTTGNRYVHYVANNVLNANKIIASITLPTVSAAVSSNSMHVFAFGTK